MGKPKIVSIVGLTASGKSAVGIELAQEFNGEIVSCDSRQVYRGLDLGTAKVTPEEQALVPHHMLDVTDPGVTFNVASFQRQAYMAIQGILERGKLPILVGGSGLYSRSIVEGYGFKLDENGKKFSDTVLSGNVPKFDVLQICLMPSKEFIAERIDTRIDGRLDAGMLEETKDLIARGVSTEWLQGLGLEYFWNVEYLSGRIGLEEYKAGLGMKTKQFAKRQRTWFKKEKNTIYLTEPETFLRDCRELVREFIR
jgi:tRNA dimethylallyltransferase